jgi:hypothetical protein
MIAADTYERALQEFLAPVQGYLNDPSVTEILINWKLLPGLRISPKPIAKS